MDSPDMFEKEMQKMELALANNDKVSSYLSRTRVQISLVL
jgi:hypothetical protein